MITQTQHTTDTPSPTGVAPRSWGRALARARALATRDPSYVSGLDAWRVHSDRSGNDYMVHPTEVDGTLTYHCDCAAGIHGLVCWHAAFVAALPVERTRRLAHRRVAARGRA